MDEVEWIVHPNGHIEGYINWQGVLNNAYRLEGRNSLLTTLGLNRARLLFECVTMTMIEAAERLYECQRQTTVHIQHLTVSNCLVNMVSLINIRICASL